MPLSFSGRRKSPISWVKDIALCKEWCGAERELIRRSSLVKSSLGILLKNLSLRASYSLGYIVAKYERGESDTNLLVVLAGNTQKAGKYVSNMSKVTEK